MKSVPRFALLCLLLVAGAAYGDNTKAVFERLRPERLAAVRQDTQRFRATLSPVAPGDDYRELRAVIHSHSYLSHDSRGTLEQMVAAARATGTQVVMLSDHPSKEHDVLTEGFSGMHDGVLFFPGAETRSLLIYSPTSLDLRAPGQQALVDEVNSRGGTTFLSHVENVEDFGIAGLTGTEIYNLHYQALLAPRIFRMLIARTKQDQERAQMLVRAVQDYPQEASDALAFRPHLYLRVLDLLSQRYRLTGVAANDSHSNSGIVVKAAPEGRVTIETVIGEPLGTADPALLPLPGLNRPGAKPGDVLFRLQFDPYDVSFRHVGTFVLARQFTPGDFLDALRAGHCYVGFDWIASPVGFRFLAERAGRRLAMMGDEVAFAPGSELVAMLPGAAVVRLYRNGERVGEVTGRSARWPLSRAGVYRVEAYVRLDGELRPWIFSNPIYVR